MGLLILVYEYEPLCNIAFFDRWIILNVSCLSLEEYKLTSLPSRIIEKIYTSFIRVRANYYKISGSVELHLTGLILCFPESKFPRSAITSIRAMTNLTALHSLNSDSLLF